MNCKENERVPITLTKYFDRIICPYCNYEFALIVATRTPDKELEENEDYSKWFIMELCTCEYCPKCGKKIREKERKKKNG